MHDRAGAAERGLAACLLPDGRRAWATTDDADIMAAMERDEWVDHAVTLTEAGVLDA